MHGSTGGGWKRNATASPRQSPTQPTSPVSDGCDRQVFRESGVWHRPAGAIGVTLLDIDCADEFTPNSRERVLVPSYNQGLPETLQIDVDPDGEQIVVVTKSLGEGDR
jgi:hypothetical protein